MKDCQMEKINWARTQLVVNSAVDDLSIYVK